MSKLTKSFIDALPLPAIQKDGRAAQVIYRDSALPGFGLRVGSGGTKTFFIEHRIKGRVKRISIGRYGPLTPSQARTKAQELLSSIILGDDPTVKKNTYKADNITLRQALNDYIAARKDLKKYSQYNYRRSLEVGLPEWMDKRLIDITKDMVESRHSEIGKETPVMANHTMRVLKLIFNHAIAKYEDDSGKSVLTANPVDRLTKARAWYKVERRRTFLAPHELAAWYEAVGQIVSSTTRDYLVFLLFTGLRKIEAVSLRWEDVSFESSSFTIADTKNGKPHTLPLTDFLTNMLKNRVIETAGSPWVFPSPTTDSYIKNQTYAVRQVINITGKPFSLHDLRRTFITIAESLDIPAYALKALLNHHNPNDVTEGYIISGVERLRAPMQKISDFICDAVKARDINEK